MNDLYESSFGGVRLWMTALQTPIGRNVVIHAPTSGDEYGADDRGRQHGVSTVTLVFDYELSDEPPRDRYARLMAQVDGEPRIFVHPLLPTVPRARMGEMTLTINEQDHVEVEAQIIPVGNIDRMPSLTASSLAAAGAARATVAANAAAAEYARIERDPAAIEAAKARAEEWGAGDATARDVITGLGETSSNLGAEAEALDDDIELWPAFLATVALGDAIRTAAQSALTDGGKRFALRVGESIGLRVLMAKIYGAENANEAYDLAMLENDIADPSSLPPGLSLSLPQRPAARGV